MQGYTPKAPKVSKEQRKIKAISEAQFHHIFNNKVRIHNLTMAVD